MAKAATSSVCLTKPFLHELGDVLYAERTLVKTLPKLEEEASDYELAEGFRAHLEETKQHVANVEKAFGTLGEKPKAEKCAGIKGIKTEHDEFVDEQALVGARAREMCAKPAENPALAAHDALRDACRKAALPYGQQEAAAG